MLDIILSIFTWIISQSFFQFVLISGYLLIFVTSIIAFLKGGRIDVGD